MTLYSQCTCFLTSIIIMVDSMMTLLWLYIIDIMITLSVRVRKFGGAPGTSPQICMYVHVSTGTKLLVSFPDRLHVWERDYKTAIVHARCDMGAAWRRFWVSDCFSYSSYLPALCMVGFFIRTR